MTAPAYGDTAPIAAPATAPGESALALVRTSGKSAIDLAASVFSRPRKLFDAPGNSIVHGWIINPAGENPGERIDEVLISVYRAPRSYTGEDSLDITCHGGAATVGGIMDVLRKAGFRDALPGEFSFRAFMNGKLDLTRAESVMELVSAKTDRSRRRAVARLSGVLEGEIRDIKTLLTRVLAGTELFLDYSEDDLSPGDGEPDRLPDRPLAEEALARLRSLAASYRMERLCHEGALVVIAGRPNAGKSSLFNRLLREDRSIVTDIPGTTRDWIEAWISIKGIPIRLADTAGLHVSGDAVERLGVERSRDLLAAADLAIYLVDGAVGVQAGDRDFFRDFAPGETKEKPPVIVVWNKVDAVPPPEGFSPGFSPAGKPLPVSAKTGAGIPELAAVLAAALETAHGGAGTDGPAGIGTPRQKELIDAALEAVEGALALADRGEPLDLIAPLFREGVNALGEITGEVTTADILELMFSRFCVGK
ncbi:MAG: tRNA uridine-5-carboxymethylaminomethyl(34) synthesis GTPase MnmE [Spirochaetaceae bacterium]|jgi:tRNA modification GTPase|nr:tRNA uridine-5-carboxymethylaminomethyl(34) synthesis GTPase MnmE [Spirochaetaceae bacterium]